MILFGSINVDKKVEIGCSHDIRTEAELFSENVKSLQAMGKKGSRGGYDAGEFDSLIIWKL